MGRDHSLAPPGAKGLGVSGAVHVGNGGLQDCPGEGGESMGESLEGWGHGGDGEGDGAMGGL